MDAAKDTRRILNEIYHPLEVKRAELTHALCLPGFELSSGFYNGHYHETPEGGYQMDYYPIPVITVKGLCDIEIEFEGLSISTKLTREQALHYPCEKLEGRTFEVYGVEDYLGSYYREGMSFEDMKRNIAQSKEEEIFFSFSFPPDVEEQKISEFVKHLRCEGFYY